MTTSTTPSEPTDADVAPAGTAGQVARLAAKCLAVAVGVYAIVALVVFCVPEGNDYGLASRKKHEWLAQDVANKIVFVGGSNLAFGMNSEIIATATGRHVVNMGMNGYFGVRFMLEEVKPELRAGDLVVIAFEYDNYFKSVDGASADLLIVGKSRPKNFAFLSWSQRVGLLEAAPYVAQQKVTRMLRGAGHAVGGALGIARDQRTDIDTVETLAGFNRYGDLRSHWEVDWQKEQEDGLDLSGTPMDAEVIPLLQSFTREMRARQVDVMMSYTPVMRRFYERHRARLEELHEKLSHAAPLQVPSPPSAFVYDDKYFFDTVYHLTREGAELRSRRVLSDIELMRGKSAAALKAARATPAP
jgi:hypothetical protein